MEDERSPTEEKVDEDVFEIIQTPHAQGDDYWSVISARLGTLDLSRRPVYQQLGIGGATGWCVGNVFKKVGKIAALTVGGGLLMLQVASQSGYVSIHWDKIGSDMKKISKDVGDKFEEYSTEEQQAEMTTYLNRGGQLVQKNIVVASGFAGGFLLGLAS